MHGRLDMKTDAETEWTEALARLPKERLASFITEMIDADPDLLA